MKKFVTMSFALLTACAMWSQQTGCINVDTGTKGTDIPKSMYGIFFEEINHSGDGGLYGEMIQNRGFSEHTVPSGCYYDNGRIYAPQGVKGWNDNNPHNWSMEWNMEQKKYTAWSTYASDCKLTREVKEMSTPLHASTPDAMEMVITESKDGAVAQLINEGYWGFAVKDGEKYVLRFYVRTSDYDGKVVAKVCDKDGKSIGEKTFDVAKNGQWTEYKGEITATKTVNNGTFRLEFSGDGTVQVDYVSVFPKDTFRGRENGLRRDVAEALEALNPDFIRWPGGCIVEGITMENRVKWKETIGDPMTRPGEYDCWGYRCTWGLGYHEALLFAEDLDMDFMYVGNLGMACSGRNADFVTTKEDLAPYVEEIRDAIEYAIGDPQTNPWAKLRAEAGHPAPFSLKYVELGNENWGPHYAKLFNWAYDELKAQYPDLVFINTMAHYDGDLKLTPKQDMVDSHYYKAPNWFYNESTFDYDNLSRNLDYKIYVGEYACNDNVGSGNLDAALSECVYMNNMERNSDIVTMTSYAPLISNQNKPDWACNLIWVNNEQTVGRASYWAQQLYANNRPDYNVRSKVSANERAPYAGRIALGTFATKASFRNVKCTSPKDGRVLFEDDLSVETGNWSNPARGEWVYEDGVLKQKNMDQSTYFTMDKLSFNDVIFECEAMKTGGDEGFLINLGCNDNDINHSWRFNIGGWGNTASNLEEATGYWGPTVGTNVPTKLENNRWYRIKMVGENGTIRCYIDDVLYEEYTPTASKGDVKSGRINMAAGYDKEQGDVVMKIVNAEETALKAAITLNASNINPSGQVTVLSGEKLYWENSFDDPELMVPQTETFSGFANEFEYTFKPYSLTIFRIKADPASQSIEFPENVFTDEPVVLIDEPEKPKTEIELAEERLSRLIARAQYPNTDQVIGHAALAEGINKATEALGNASRTIESLNTAWRDLCAALEAFYQANMLTENECTDKIENANFTSMSAKGWHGSSFTLGENVAEFYNCNFGVYQTVEGLEKGLYLLTVQGFYRCGYNPWQDLIYQNLHATLHGNDQSTPLRGLYSNDTFEWNMKGAAELFGRSQTTSLNYVTCEVGEDGVLRIELNKETAVEGDWTCWNNFRLFRIGDESGIGNVLADEQPSDNANDNVYDVAGRYVGNASGLSNLSPGIYIANGKKIIVK